LAFSKRYQHHLPKASDVKSAATDLATDEREILLDCLLFQIGTTPLYFFPVETYPVKLLEIAAMMMPAIKLTI